MSGNRHHHHHHTTTPPPPEPTLTDIHQQLTSLHALLQRTASSVAALERAHASHREASLAHLADLQAGQERLADEVLLLVRGASFRGSGGAASSSIMGGSVDMVSEMGGGGGGGGSVGSGMGGLMREGAWCGHDVRKPPRKVGRRIVGYVYEREESGGREGGRRG
jgi:hypothetical protein